MRDRIVNNRPSYVLVHAILTRETLLAELSSLGQELALRQPSSQHTGSRRSILAAGSVPHHTNG